MLDDAVEEGGEGARVAEGARVDGIEDLGEGRLQLVVVVEVGMAEVFDVFGEVAEEEDVLLADLAGDFDLGSVSLELDAERERGLRWRRRRFR